MGLWSLMFENLSKSIVLHSSLKCSVAMWKTSSFIFEVPVSTFSAMSLSWCKCLIRYFVIIFIMDLLDPSALSQRQHLVISSAGTWRSWPSQKDHFHVDRKQTWSVSGSPVKKWPHWSAMKRLKVGLKDLRMLSSAQFPTRGKQGSILICVDIFWSWSTVTLLSLILLLLLTFGSSTIMFRSINSNAKLMLKGRTSARPWAICTWCMPMKVPWPSALKVLLQMMFGKQWNQRIWCQFGMLKVAKWCHEAWKI